MSEKFPSKQNTTKTHSSPSTKRKMVFLEKSDSEDSYEIGKPLKFGKKNLKNKAKPKKWILLRNLIPEIFF